MCDSIYLSEATTDDLIEELYSRVGYLALCYEKPSSEGLFITIFKGSYVEMWGSVKALEAEMRQRDRMANKGLFEDEYSNDEEDDIYE